jgi:hypothetical protein
LGDVDIKDEVRDEIIAIPDEVDINANDQISTISPTEPDVISQNWANIKFKGKNH